MTRFIFVTGGVVSSLGKGLSAASLAALLQARDYKVRLRKLDPYLNVDPGTMSPTQHGEVFVTDDGAETDLDLGHYERFSGVNALRGDNVTSGWIYSTLITKERRGDYLGGTVQVIPHVTNLIKKFVLGDSEDLDFLICEIGGTVGDIEGLPFFEAIRQLGYELGKERSLFVHLTLVPYIPAAKELKTKPTQHSVKELRSIGIQPDILLCRSDREIPESDRRKIALFCNIKEDSVVQALDVDTIYRVPLSLHEQGFDKAVLKHFNLLPKETAHNSAEMISPDLSKWQEIVDIVSDTSKEITVAVIGKYIDLKDAYKSIIESFSHAGIANKVKVTIEWVDARKLQANDTDLEAKLAHVQGILIPGGFGTNGAIGKRAAITYARERHIPLFGICFGMQLAVMEFARNVLGIKDASSSEFDDSGEPIVGLMTEWSREGETEKRSHNNDLGGTMRLGAYECKIQPDSKAYSIYGKESIYERHRHRYEVNISYKERLEAAGMKISGMSPDGKLPEIVEITDHPWFVCVQFHPEFKSRPFQPHPLFASFVKAAMRQAKILTDENSSDSIQDNVHPFRV